MEFNERRIDPPSTRELLYNQVKEQSDLCDITIKHGFWEKRFHWCVLVASPYFENIRRNSFLEKDLGIVSMKVGTPVSLEEAILFLYGNNPKLHMQNIGTLLDIAEYLMIPELKGQCVEWIKSKSPNTESCIPMLELASLYDFVLPTYEEYLIGRIPDLMETDGMLDLTYESVEYLYTDPSLSYVNVYDKFSFLVRWTNKRSNRKPLFEDLLKHVDFRDAEKDFIETVVLNEPLIQKLENATDIMNSLKLMDSCGYCDVLFFPGELYDNKIQCFDLTRKRWCSINVRINNKLDNFQMNKMRRSWCQRDIEGPHIYVLNEDCAYFRKSSIFILNLDNDTVKESEIEFEDSYEEQIRYNNDLTFLWQDKIFLISEERMQHTCSYRTSINPPQLPFLGSLTMRRLFSCSVLYTGSLQNEIFLIKPVLSIRDKVSTLCANNTFIAMVSDDAKHLYLFNVVEHSFDALTIDFDKDGQRVKLARIGNDGFVLYNNTSFMTIERQSGLDLCQKYRVDRNQFSVDVNKGYNVNEYYMCDNKWYHYSRSAGGDTEFRWTTHDILVTSIYTRKNGSDIDQRDVWESLPIDGYKRLYQSLGPNVLQIRLSKDRLACARDCPHCMVQDKSKVVRQTTTSVYYHDSDHNDTDDDIDHYLYDDFYDSDDYYGYREESYNAFRYHSDQNYYNDSD